MVKWLYHNIMCHYKVRSNMKHYTNSSFYKHMENIRGSHLPDIHALKNQLDSLTAEIIELIQANKKQHNTQNRA